MQQKIFSAIFLTCVSMLVLVNLLLLFVLESSLQTQAFENLKKEATLLKPHLSSLFTQNLYNTYRVSIIAQDGTLLYDSTDIAINENHSDREEIQNAFKYGEQTNVRYSHTLKRDMLYFATTAMLEEKPVVLRLSVEKSSIEELFFQFLSYFGLEFVCCLFLSFVIAKILTRSIITPLQNFKLQDLNQEMPYQELKPFIDKVKVEHKLVKNQLKILKQKQGQILLLAQNMSDGLMLLNKQGKILLVNKRAHEYFGGIKEAYSIYDLKDSFFLQRLILALHRFKKEKSPSKVLEIEHKECEVIFGPIYSKKKFKGMVVLLRDLNARKQAQMLQKKFSANVTHELKTPLTTILALSEMIHNNLVATRDLPDFVQKIENEAKRLLTIIDEVLKLSFLDEQGSLPMQKINLKPIIQNVIERLKIIAQKQHIKIRAELNDCYIMGNTELIENLVYNLCDNAIKYNKPKGLVFITLYTYEQEVFLSVRDTGIGIPKDSIPKVFERFFCVDKVRSKQLGGTGLGLSIVESVAAYHNAKIEVKSKLDEGSTFSLRFGLANT